MPYLLTILVLVQFMTGVEWVVSYHFVTPFAGVENEASQWCVRSRMRLFPLCLWLKGFQWCQIEIGQGGCSEAFQTSDARSPLFCQWGVEFKAEKPHHFRLGVGAQDQSTQKHSYSFGLNPFC